MSKYQSTWHLDLNEFTLVHTVRYLDPKNGKRFAAPYKTKEKAQAKMDQLKRDGAKDIKITQDTLRGNIKFKEDTDNERLADLRTRQMMKQTKLRELDPSKEADKVTMTKNDIENIELKMKSIKDKMQKEESDHEVSMARGELEAISDKALELSSALEGMSDEGNPLEAWVQSKITKAKDYINSVSDYLMYNPDIKMNENLDEAISDAQLDKIRDSYKDLKTISPEKVKTLRNFLDKYSTDSLMQLAQANINFVSTMARSVMNKRKMGDPKHAGSMRTVKATKDFEKDLVAEADLNKDQIKKVHKMADDLPKKDFKDRYGKEKGDAVRYATATNIVKKKEGIKEMQQIDEKIEGLKNKSEKSGIPYGILKQVYNRGMAAWKGGHRPGTTPQQWAFARVNAFITKGKAYYTADADLAKKARAAKKKK